MERMLVGNDPVVMGWKRERSRRLPAHLKQGKCRLGKMKWVVWCCWRRWMARRILGWYYRVEGWNGMGKRVRLGNRWEEGEKVVVVRSILQRRSMGFLIRVEEYPGCLNRRKGTGSWNLGPSFTSVGSGGTRSRRRLGLLWEGWKQEKLR